MRTFDKFPEDSICPICKTNKKGKGVLICVVGTSEGLNCEAKVFHLDCIDLWYDKNNNLIYQKVKEE